MNANVFCGSKVEFEIENTEYLNSKTVLRIYYLLGTVNSTGTSRGKQARNHTIILQKMDVQEVIFGMDA